MNYRTLPLIRLLIAFIAGIIVFVSLGGITVWFRYASIGLIVFCVIWLLFNWLREWHASRLIVGFMVYISFFVAGILTAQRYYNVNVVEPSLGVVRPGEWVAEVMSKPALRPGSIRLNVRVIAVKSGNNIERTHFGAVLYLPLAATGVPRVRDVIAVNAPLKEIPKPLNPGVFDYRTYLARRGIHRQAWLPDGSFKVLNAKGDKTIFYYAEKVRSKLLEIVARQLPDKSINSVASALLLGYGDLLDPELRQAYSGAGAMHVLCVSGLHVGILYAVFAALLFPLGRGKRSEIVKTILLLLLIWGYALIAGLSVSVVRSATMFTFVAIGKGFHRRTSALNSLIASCFFLLIINPYYLFEVGFQLSFAAVAGIVLFQPVLEQFWHAENRVVVYVRDLLTVSLAAQLFTMPVTFLNFHQLPNYFLLANLVVIPLSFCILVTGMAAMAFYFLPYVGEGLSWMLGSLIGLMNRSVAFIEHLPGSVSSITVFNNHDAVLLYAVVLGLVFWLVLKYRQGFWLAIVSLLVLVGSVQVQRLRFAGQKVFVVADGGKHLLLGTIKGRKAEWEGTSPGAPQFCLSGVNQYFGISPDHFSYNCLNATGDVLSSHFRIVDRYRVVLIDSSFRLMRGDSHLSADFVLVGLYPRMKPEWVVPRVDSAVWVLTSGLRQADRQRWEKECMRRKALVYRMDSLGALIVSD